MRLLLTLVLGLGLAAPAQAGDLDLEITFREQQERREGSRSRKDTCQTTIGVKTLGNTLFIENKSSNCRVFRLKDLRGADGSASASVFTNASRRTETKCRYDGKTRVEVCSDGTRIRVPGAGKVSYQATYTRKSSFKRSARTVQASRSLIRLLESAQGSNQLAESEAILQVSLSGGTCKLQKFEATSEYRVATNSTKKWSGVRLRESRKMASAGTCKVNSQ